MVGWAVNAYIEGMKTICKYEIDIQKADWQTIKMPTGAELLSVQVQHGTPVLWAAVDTELEHEDRNFEIFGTGIEMHANNGVSRRFVGTFQMHEGHLVLHLFERLKDMT